VIRGKERASGRAASRMGAPVARAQWAAAAATYRVAAAIEKL
jgi:hypothetical protein